MFRGVNEFLFTACVAAPKNEYNVFFLVGYELDNTVCKPCPTAFGMGICLMRAYGKGSVHKQYAFLCPFGQSSVFRPLATDVGF